MSTSMNCYFCYNQKMQKTKKKKVRLDSSIVPHSYHLTIIPDMDAFVFSGNEDIQISINKETKSLTLHAKDIEVENVRVIYKKVTQYVQKVNYNPKDETVSFIFKDSIPKGKLNLKLSFKGIINESLRGFYKSSYVLDGDKKHIATTQFEATDARRCFPCFDEPAQKAIFHVELIVPNTHTAISNTLPTEIREHSAGFNIVKFAPTPQMSTYLLAFIIGEFEFIEGKTKDNVRVRVFTTKGKKHQAIFALDVAIKSLEFYNEYFKIDYPLPILDLIAIPDFESGAMENWGAVTFRETALLVDDEHSSLSNKQWVALVIAHEIAHQWFGNLVTMHWWTDLWLNEGFASYIEYKAIDHIYPQWQMWDQFLTSDTNVALKLDSLKNSHPIEVEVHHPDQINEIFDAVSYSKGACIIKMLADYLGEEVFRDGLRYYLKKHSYKNTNTIDLWDSFEKISKKKVGDIMKNWTSKTGYPLVTLSRIPEARIQKSQKPCFWNLKQERFFSSRISSKENKEKTLWQIPFSYESNSSKLTTLLTKKENSLIGEKIGKLNLNENSFIRTSYDRDSLASLSIEIENKTLNTKDRLALIRDLFALAEGGYIKSIDALDFSLSYKDETEYIVWSEISSGLNKIYNIVLEKSDEKTKNLYKKYVLELFSPLAKRMTFEKIKNEKHDAVFLRNLALSNSAFYGDKSIIKNAQIIFKNRDSKKIDADIRSVVYAIIANYSTNKEWSIFKNLYEKEEMHEEKDRLVRALTQFKDKTLIAKTLTFIISDKVRSQDTPHLITSTWLNSVGRDLTWVFVKHNWPNFLKKYGEGGHFLGRMLSAIGTHTTSKDATEIKKFFKINAAPGADRTLEQGYERIYSNEAWTKSDKKLVEKWLAKNFR